METTTQTTPKVDTPNSGKMLGTMVGLGVICALLIVLTYEGTFDRIESLKAQALEQAIFKVVPGTETTKVFLVEDGSIKEVSKDTKDGNLIYGGYDSAGKLMGVALPAQGQGYGDILKILYGYSLEKQSVIGFYVLESKETPGLGDKIEKDVTFLANFETLDLSLNDDKSALKNAVVTVKSGEKNNPWEVDGITGATISSRAIGKMINESAQSLVPVIQKNSKVLTGK